MEQSWLPTRSPCITQIGIWLTTVFLSTSAVCAGQTSSSDPAELSRTGRFDLTFTPRDLLDAATLESIQETIHIDDEIRWDVFVPDNYDPDKPAGLLVYISPSRDGTIPGAWAPVLTDKNIIWISEDDAGNRSFTPKRILTAVLAPRIIGDMYRIDTQRMYVSGFSGGGKVACIVSIDFANLFKGAMYIGGAEMWEPDPPPLLDQVKANYYAFITGTRDFNRKLTRRIYNAYLDEGASNALLLDIPGLSHDLPNAKNFARAIEFLDSRLETEPKDR